MIGIVLVVISQLAECTVVHILWMIYIFRHQQIQRHFAILVGVVSLGHRVEDYVLLLIVGEMHEVLVVHRQQLHLLLILFANSMNTKKTIVISLICIFVIVLLGMLMVYRLNYNKQDDTIISENVTAKVQS